MGTVLAAKESLSADPQHQVKSWSGSPAREDGDRQIPEWPSCSRFNERPKNMGRWLRGKIVLVLVCMWGWGLLSYESRVL